jgi:bifunctional enzyme CysN/CysC
MPDQSPSITRQDRENLNGHKGVVLWFTGLSGSGRSTLANGLEQALHRVGKRSCTLDGDHVRQGLCKDLGYAPEDRRENIRRLAEVAKLMMDAGLIVITAFISPFRNDREFARQLIGADDFIEIHLSTPLEVCEQRDIKGLYEKARAGVLLNMTGIDSAYEAPEHPHASIDSSVVSTSAAVEMVLNLLPD